MYSIQHVLWRGAMALSLLAVGGFGAYSAPVGVQSDIACNEAAVVAHAVQSSREIVQLQVRAAADANATAFRHVQFQTIVVRGIPPEDA